MSDDDHLLLPGSSGFYRRVALAPACLCLVAILQFARAEYWHQTPWKGGGFGMFSSVDTRATRYLRIYLMTDGGSIPVELPSRLRYAGNELRTAPAQEKIDDLAVLLARFQWHDTETQWRRIASSTAQSPRGQPADSNWLMRNDSRYPHDDWTQPGMKSTVEPLARHQNSQESHRTIDFNSVRVELWRYEFRADRGQLNAKKFLEADCARNASKT